MKHEQQRTEMDKILSKGDTKVTTQGRYHCGERGSSG